MVFGPGLLGLAVIALWVWSVFDAISTDEALVRNLPKIVWVLLVILFPPIGPIAWLLLGRPEGAGFRVGDRSHRGDSLSRGSRPPRGPDDSPEFIAGLEDETTRLRRWEEELKRREDELKRREEGDQGTT